MLEDRLTGFEKDKKIEDILERLSDRGYVSMVLEGIKNNHRLHEVQRLIENMKEMYAKERKRKRIVDLVATASFKLFEHQFGSFPTIQREVANEVLKGTLSDSYVKEAFEDMHERNTYYFILIKALEKGITNEDGMQIGSYERFLIKVMAAAMYRAVDNQIILNFLEQQYATKTTHLLPK